MWLTPKTTRYSSAQVHIYFAEKLSGQNPTSLTACYSHALDIPPGLSHFPVHSICSVDVHGPWDIRCRSHPHYLSHCPVQSTCMRYPWNTVLSNGYLHYVACLLHQDLYLNTSIAVAIFYCSCVSSGGAPTSAGTSMFTM